MKIINFKPESVQVFCNSQIYYISGVSLTEIRHGEELILKEGSLCQLYAQWCSNLTREKILAGENLIAVIDTFSRECKIRGRLGLRFSVISFEDEDDLGKNDL